MRSTPPLAACASLAILLVAPLGCTDGDDDGDAGGDAAVVDAGLACHPNLPAPSDPCLEGQCGNDRGVGQPCSKDGNECAEFASLPDGSIGAAFCTADYSDTGLHFCTRACASDSQCGEGAICEVDPDDPDSEAGCVPNACVGAGDGDGGT